MSSVGSADKRSQQDEALRRTRETYQEKEVDQSKKHSQELKQLTEVHQTELREMEEAHTRQMEDLKVRTREAISARDMRYQKEIEDLRSMHQNQARRSAQEADVKQKQIQEFMKGQLQTAVAIKDRQSEEQKTQYEAQLGDNTKRFTEGLDQNRQMAKKSIDSEKQKLMDAHKKEMDAIVQDRNRQVDQSQRSLRSLRKTKEQQIKNLEEASRQNQDRLSQSHMSTLREQAADHDIGLTRARAGLSEGLEQNRARYEKALEENVERYSMNSEAFKSSIQDRIDNKINVREAENRTLKNDFNRQKADLLNQKNREVANVRSAMGENIDQLEKARSGIVEASNARNAKVLKNVVEEKDQHLVETNRFFQDKISVEKSKSDEHLVNTKLGYERELAMKDLQANTREEKIKGINQREEEYLKTFYSESLNAIRGNFDTSLREIRDKNKRDQDLIFQNFSKQSAEREVKFQAKLTDLNERHQEQLQKIKAEQANMMKGQANISAKEKKVIVEQKNVEMQRQAAQFENRIAKLEETHRREVESLNRRHDESLVSMTRAKPKA
jgi:hypothetical protein